MDNKELVKKATLIGDYIYTIIGSIFYKYINKHKLQPKVAQNTNQNS